MTPSEREQKQVDVLLATYTATKNEIARRSALQWAILAGYAFILYRGFIAILQPDFSQLAGPAWLLAIWATSLTGFFFHRREQLEIMRLSRVISDLVESGLKTVGVGGLFERWGLTNHVQAEWVGYKCKVAGRLEWGFQIIVFLGGPIGITAIALAHLMLEPWVTAAILAAIVCAAAIGYLLGMARN